VSLTHSLVDLPRWGLATADDHSDIFLLHCARSCNISFSWMYSQPVHSSMSCIHCLLGLPWCRSSSMIPSRTVSANCPALPQLITLLVEKVYYDRQLFCSRLATTAIQDRSPTRKLAVQEWISNSSKLLCLWVCGDEKTAQLADRCTGIQRHQHRIFKPLITAAIVHRSLEF